MLVNLQVLPQLFEICFNLQIQKQIVVVTTICGNTVCSIHACEIYKCIALPCLSDKNQETEIPA